MRHLLSFIVFLVIRNASAGIFSNKVNRKESKNALDVGQADGSQCARLVDEALETSNKEIDRLSSELEESRSKNSLALNEIIRMTKELEDTKNTLTNRIVQLGSNLHEVKTETIDTISRMKEKYGDIEAIVEEAKKTAVSEIELELEAANVKLETTIEKLTEECEDAKSTLQGESNNIIAQLQENLEKTKKDREEKIAIILQEQEKFEISIKKESNDFITNLENTLKQTKNDAVKSIELLKQEHDDAEKKLRSKFTMKIEQLERRLEDKDEERVKGIFAIEEVFNRKILAQEEKIEKLLEKKNIELDSMREEKSKHIAAMEKQVIELMKQKQNELESLREEKSKEKKIAVKKEQETSDRIIANHMKERETLKESHKNLVDSLKAEMETKEREAMNQVMSMEIELEERMKQLKLETNRYIDEKEGKHSREVQDLFEALETLKNDHADLEKHISQLERKYSDATKEIEEWQDTFEGRSYCNLTHIQEDAASTVATIAGTAKQMAVTHAIKATKIATRATIKGTGIAARAAIEASKIAAQVIEPHIETGRKLYDQHAKDSFDKHVSPFHEAHIKPAITESGKKFFLLTKTATQAITLGTRIATETAIESKKLANTATEVATTAMQPHIETGRIIYDQHLKKSVDKHILPIHMAYLQPALRKSGKHLTRGKQEASSLIKRFRQFAISGMKTLCLEVNDQIQSGDVPNIFRIFERKICKEPELTVDNSFLVVLFLIILRYRRLLWRLMKRLLYFPIITLWHATPLQLFRGSKRGKISLLMKSNGKAIE